jgi:hypothetical protein
MGVRAAQNMSRTYPEHENKAKENRQTQAQVVRGVHTAFEKNSHWASVMNGLKKEQVQLVCTEILAAVGGLTKSKTRRSGLNYLSPERHRGISPPLQTGGRDQHQWHYQWHFIGLKIEGSRLWR